MNTVREKKSSPIDLVARLRPKPFIAPRSSQLGDRTRRTKTCYALVDRVLVLFASTLAKINFSSDCIKVVPDWHLENIREHRENIEKHKEKHREHSARKLQLKKCAKCAKCAKWQNVKEVLQSIIFNWFRENAAKHQTSWYNENVFQWDDDGHECCFEESAAEQLDVSASEHQV